MQALGEQQKASSLCDGYVTPQVPVRAQGSEGPREPPKAVIRSNK